MASRGTKTGKFVEGGTEEQLNLRLDSATRYTLRDEIGRGGMGVVFLAERASAHGVSENVVLKTISDLADTALEALREEANLTTRLRHQNIVRTHALEAVPLHAIHPRLEARLEPDDAPPAASTGLRRRRPQSRRPSRDGGPELEPLSARRKAEGDEPLLYFIVMDYIDGVDLSDLLSQHIQQGCLLPSILGAYIISRVARALEYAHNTVVHRDVSAENVLIDSLGVPLLSDFGVAVAHGGSAPRAGKLSYMAPEVIRGEPADERADIYALGMLAAQLATGMSLQHVPAGCPPEQRDEALQQQIAGGFPELTAIMPEIPEVYASIIARMVSADPERRPPRAGVVASEIEQRVLYAYGFGPTNKSLASYIEIFDSGFAEYTDEQLDELSFLRDAGGNLMLRRELTPEIYSPTGHQMILARPRSLLARSMAQAQRRPFALRHAHSNRPVLKVRFGDNCLESLQVKGEIEIGRSANGQVMLLDPRASRRHARVRLTTAGPMLEDQGSNNGTYLADRRIEKSILAEGDRFRIGSTLLYYLQEPWFTRPEELPEAGIPAEFVPPVESERRSLRFRVDQRTEANPLWRRLADDVGLSERAGFVLSQGVTEACGLLGEPAEELIVEMLHERSRLRFFVHCPAESPRLAETLLLFKQLVHGGTVEMDSRAIAATVVRQIFDRIDFYLHDQLLQLSKSI